MKYEIISSVPALTHPRSGYIHGVDYGAEGIILAAQEFQDYPRKLLVWVKGSSGSVNGHHVYYPPDLRWIIYEPERPGCDQSSFAVYSPRNGDLGSRLSKLLLVQLGEEIAARTGLYFDWRKWNRGETLIFTERSGLL